ncbi:MAG: GyrI-like domain-containing protein [Ginsengibacter sp.]
MKALLISVTVVCILLLASIYLFIPLKIAFSKVIIIKTKINIANRFLFDENKWGAWFPTDSVNAVASSGINTYLYKGHFYSIKKKMLNAAEASISNDQISLKSFFTMISINEDSIAIEWKSNMPETSNPFNRLRDYIEARRLQKNMTDILIHLKTFLGKNENIYGINLHVIISKDSTLIATKSVTTHYPSTSNIYNLIGSLQKYIAGQGAKENNFPMLNVKNVNDTAFETMVAIPVNKYLKGNDTIFNKRFVPWKVLTAEVKGGNYTVNNALHQMAIYLTDYHIPAMAIPFASLVTDRSKQPDTLQWITRIYTPVP